MLTNTGYTFLYMDSRAFTSFYLNRPKFFGRCLGGFSHRKCLKVRHKILHSDAFLGVNPESKLCQENDVFLSFSGEKKIRNHYYVGHLKKMFWFSDNGFQKKGKVHVGRVFIFCFYFQSNMGRVFIFCFYFQLFKNITQTSSILLFWQTNNTLVFTLSFSIDQSFKRLSKLVRVTGTLENLNLAVNLNFFLFKNTTRRRFFFCTAIKTSHRPKFWGGRRCLRTRNFILFGLI